MRRIAVLGCGFGGFKAARELESALVGRRRVQLTVVSDRSHFVYTPLLPSVATGKLDVAHITFPIRAAFDKSTEVLIDPIDAIDLDRRVLRGRNGDTEFDYLLVAVGSQIDWHGQTHWRPHTLTCKSARDGVRLREAVSQALRDAAGLATAEERARRLTFVVGGAGATGVELAGELLTTLRTEVAPRISAELAQALRVVLVEQQERVLPRMPGELSQLARAHLCEFGMELRLGTEVVDRNANEVVLSTGEVIAADNFLWCGGIRVPDLVARSGFEVDEHGRIVIDDTLETPAHPGIYAIGDVAGPDADIPQNARVASQQAPVAARNILAQLSGRAGRSWDYHHHGELIALGHQNALAYIADTAIEGRGARSLYRLVHTALMPTGAKKAQLLKEWLLSRFRRPPQAAGLLEAAQGQAHLGSDLPE